MKKTLWKNRRENYYRDLSEEKHSRETSKFSKKKLKILNKSEKTIKLKK